MTRIRWVWLVCGGLYAAFFSWYTSFGGPLSAEEIDTFMARFEQREPAPEPETLALLRKFMQEDTGDDFVMVNVIDMYDTPLQIEGVEPGDTADDVLGKYMQYMYPALFSRASHPVLFGDASNLAMDLMNAPGMAHWTASAGMRYRSRRDLLEISSNPAFPGSHDFKVAAMRKTIAFPLDPWFQLGDPRFVLALFLGFIGCALSWREAARMNNQLQQY
ncbi:hypothetical protein OAL10_11665 [Gammaproteobacteria bacterium]|nr:hypothetical protein [Gammaproteobacteria bacterium]